ncbi:MAG: OB-fold-containig protein [Pseudomonadota bacterium]
MWSFLISPEMYPFTGAILFVAGLVLLEIIALLLGGSLIGMDADGPDLDADFEFDFDAEPDFDAEIAEADAISGVENSGGFLGWVGLKDAPFVLWLAGVATAFGVSGYALQLASKSVLGGTLPAALAALIALFPGLWGGKFFAAALAKLAPKTETSAVSRRHLSGRRGVITQGKAERGRPAECRITDRHGNSQYIRVEPQKDGEVIPQGSDVIVLRPKNGIYPVIAFDAG